MQGFGSYETDNGRRLCYRPAVPPFPKVDEVWPLLDRANQALAGFDRALAAFPVPGVVGKLFARLDAVHSSGAEGTTTTFTDLMEYQTATQRAPDPEDARQVSAAAEAFDDLAASRATPTQMVLDIHRRLFAGAKDPFAQAQAGQWKTYPNGTFDPDGADGHFYFCRPQSLPAVLAEWEALTLDADDRPELVRQALSHWMFVHIHPVHDGNGRVGRLLVPTLMRRKGALTQACAFLGEAVHHNKEIYVEALNDGRRSGNFAAWSRVFCSMIMQTAAANTARLERLGEVHRRWLAATRKVRAHSVVHDLLPWVLTKPSFTVGDAVAATGGKASYQGVNSAIARLVELGIVAASGAERRNRLFIAKEILDLFEPVVAPGPNIG
jgi:Fic family protein